MSRLWKVLLCGYYGMGNLGDELLARASIALFESCGVARGEMAMLSGCPEESQEFHGIQAFDRWSPKSIFSAARQSDTFLLGGGGLFQDSTSLRTPLYYWLAVKTARLAGCKVWAAGQSIGPLRRKISRALARNAFSSCRSVMVRDGHSRDFLGGRALLSEDLVLALPSSRSEKGGSRFLLNLRAWDGRLEYEAARAFSTLALPEGTSVVGVAMDRGDARLMEKMDSDGQLRLDELVCPSLGQVPEVFRGGASALGMRLHFGVLCMKSAIPCALIPYDPKVSAFARRWGAALWNGGAMELPRPWERAPELLDAVESLKLNFHECFEKVLKG